MASKAANPIGFQSMLAAIIAISILESLLAGFGIIPPMLSYSPANLLFAFLRLAILAYAGWAYAPSGVARAALRGGALFLASSLALCIAAIAAKNIATHPILGVFVPDGALMALFAVIVVQNTLMGAAIAAVVAWLSRQKFFQGLFTAKKS